MSTTLKTIAIILGTFLLPFITSLLLEIPIVKAHWARVTLVILLMAVELLIGVMMFMEVVKQTTNSN